jgi:hypothetical protein
MSILTLYSAKLAIKAVQYSATTSRSRIEPRNIRMWSTETLLSLGTIQIGKQLWRHSLHAFFISTEVHVMTRMFWRSKSTTLYTVSLCTNSLIPLFIYFVATNYWSLTCAFLSWEAKGKPTTFFSSFFFTKNLQPFKERKLVFFTESH